MAISDCEVRDPRIRRTRQLLQGALQNLMQTKGFDEISVQDITDLAAVTAAIRRVLMEGMPKDSFITGFPPVMIATTAGWAIYGAVKEWFNTPDRPQAEEIVPVILRLVLPILQTAKPVDSPYSTPVA